MDFRAPVRRSRTVQFGIPEHAGERRDAEPLDVGAREEPRFDFGDDRLLFLAAYAKGASDARAIEKRIDDDRLAVALDVEMRKAREFFWAWQCRVDRHAACRKSILL